MNKAIKIFAADARPLRRVIAFVDQTFSKTAVFVKDAIDGLKPPAGVILQEQVDTDTGVVTQVFTWLSFRLDICPDRLYTEYSLAMDKYELSGDMDDLNSATRMQVRAIAFRCQDDNGGYWALQNGTRLRAVPEFEVPLSVNLTNGVKGAMKIAQITPCSPAELTHLSNGDIYDAGHRGYAVLDPVPKGAEIKADVPDTAPTSA